MKTALINAGLLTMDARRPRAEALLIEGERIARVGAKTDLLPLADEIIDLNGRTVLPGFIDAHVHVVWTGMALTGVDLIGATTLDEIVERVAQAAGNTPVGDWIFGNGYDQSIIEGHRPPTCVDLDRASTRHPVLLRARGGHSCVVNTKGLETLANASSAFRIPHPELRNGWLRGEANRHALAVTGRGLDDEARLDAARRCAELALRKGVTTLHAMQRVGGDDDEFPVKLRDAKLPARMVVHPTTTDVGWVLRRGFDRIGGCLLIDGGIESYTAAVFGGYADRPETNGRLHFSDGELRQFFERAHVAGLQIVVHAIGDRGIAEALDAHQEVLRRFSRDDHRHRIEHFLVPRPEDIRRAGDLGVAVCAQPAFERFWGGREGWFSRFLGAERMMRSTPLRSLRNASVLLGGGSDSGVTPIDPLLGVQSAVLHPNEAERISVEDALQLFTSNAARLAFMEDEVGSIAEGKEADLAVLSADPTACDPSRLADIVVEETWVGGKVMWRRPLGSRSPELRMGD